MKIKSTFVALVAALALISTSQAQTEGSSQKTETAAKTCDGACPISKAMGELPKRPTRSEKSRLVAPTKQLRLLKSTVIRFISSLAKKLTKRRKQRSLLWSIKQNLS